MAMAVVSEYGAGTVFGAALYLSGVWSPAVITGQMELTSFHMMKTMLTASAASALIIHSADHLKFATMKVRTPSSLGFFPYDGNVVGGVLLGLGMALTGACPGTGLVQMAVGLPEGRFVVLGGLLGAMLYSRLRSAPQHFKTASARGVHNASSLVDQHPPGGATTPHAMTSSPQHMALSSGKRMTGVNVSRARSTTGPSTNTKAYDAATVTATFGLSKSTVLTSWELICLLLIWLATFLAHPQVRYGLVDPISGGMLIGVAQAACVGLNRHPIGVSGAYADLSRWISRPSVTTKTTNQVRVRTDSYLLTPSIAFAVGILSSSAVLARLLSPPNVHSFAHADSMTLGAAAMSTVGGMAMVLGARCAGGCTSGHGISGLATFGWSSMISTATMLGAGVLSTQLAGGLGAWMAKQNNL